MSAPRRLPSAADFPVGIAVEPCPPTYVSGAPRAAADLGMAMMGVTLMQCRSYFR